MHQNNKDRNPHNENTVMRRAEIVIRFDVPEAEASQDFLDAMVGSIRRDLKHDKDFVDMSAEIEGKWL